jgi:hypothetical protein
MSCLHGNPSKNIFTGIFSDSTLIFLLFFTVSSTSAAAPFSDAAGCHESGSMCLKCGGIYMVVATAAAWAAVLLLRR